MGKSAIRILPPLVNGKLSGILEFGVDFVEITEKIFKNEDRSFLVQIIWWGETTPLVLRPLKSKYITDDNKKVIVNEQDGCTVKYEVRTKIKLFNSYLTKCEEVELTILDSVKNEIIGSTLLRDLIYVVYNVESFIKSIISDTGDAIGKITCHFKFFEADSTVQNSKVWKTGIDHVPAEKWNNNDLKLNLNLSELYFSRDNIPYQYESSRTNKENGSERIGNVHYNSPARGNPELTTHESPIGHLSEQDVTCLENADSNQLKPSTREWEDCIELDTKSSDYGHCAENVITKPTRHSTKENRKTAAPRKGKMSAGKKEEVTIRTVNADLKRPAKVFDKKARISKVVGCAESSMFPKKKPAITSEKSVKSMKKVRGKPLETMNVKTSAKVPKFNKTSIVVSTPAVKSKIKTFENVSSEISKLHKLYLNGEPHKNHSNIENVPVKENVKDDVEDCAGECAVIKEKSQSPPVITSQSKQPASPEDTEYVESTKVNVNNKLFFDLNDPIEKLYYETFFQKIEVPVNNEFEMAELLNQPGNNYIGESTSRDGIELGNKLLVEKKSQTENDVDVKSRSHSLVDVRENDTTSNEKDGDGGDSISDGKDSILSRKEIEFRDCNYGSEKSSNPQEYKTDCHRCKYYKKLSELDNIIVALRNFESNLRTEVKKDPNAIDHLHNEFRTSLPEEMMQDDENTEISDPGDLTAVGNESDYSKEDSDFMEFRRYLSKR